MKNEIENTGFMNWCKHMFEENCQERWQHGQQPYKDVSTYVTKNKSWLEKQYERDVDREVFNLL